MEVSKPKLVNPITNIIGVNSLRLGSLHILQRSNPTNPLSILTELLHYFSQPFDFIFKYISICISDPDSEKF